MTYKAQIEKLVENVARDDLGAAAHSFKDIMASKLMDKLTEQSVKIQNKISEAYPEIFDSPVDVEAATGDMPNIEDYPVDSDDDMIEPEEGKESAEANYTDGEDQEVYEQIVVDGGSMADKEDAYDKVTEESDEEDLEEEDKPDFADVDGDGDKEEPVTQAAKDKKQGAS